MSVSSIGSATSTSSTAQAELLKAQQKLAIDTAAKAAAKVISEDKVAVAKSRTEIAQAQTTSGALDVTI